MMTDLEVWQLTVCFLIALPAMFVLGFLVAVMVGYRPERKGHE